MPNFINRRNADTQMVYSKTQVVRALRIDRMVREKVQNTDSKGAVIELAQLGDSGEIELSVEVSQSWVTEMKPKVGWYYVEWNDGTGVVDGDTFRLEYEVETVYTEEDALIHKNG